MLLINRGGIRLLRLLFILILALFISLPATAQDKWESGFIVKESSGDTLEGFIRVRGEDAVSRSMRVIYKNNEDSAPREYTPRQIAHYQFGPDRVYTSRRIHKSKTTLDSSRTVFLRMLVRGPAKLYSYYPKYARPLYYIEDARGNFFSLERSAVAVTRDNKTINYAGILHLAFYDCPMLDIDEDRVQLKQKPLVTAVNAYNECVDSDYQPSLLADRSTTNVDWGIKFGAGGHALNHSYSVFNVSQKARYTRYSPYISLYSEFTFVGFDPRFALRTELAYQKKGNTSGEDIWFELPYINLSIWPKYELSASDLIPYIGLGITGGYLLNSNETPYKSRKNGTYIPIGQQPLDPDKNHYNKYYEMGLMGEAGIEFSLSQKVKASLSLRGERTLIPFNFSAHAYRTNSLIMVMGIHLR